MQKGSGVSLRGARDVFWERHWKAFFFVSLYHSFPFGALELLSSFVFVTQEYCLIRNMTLCLSLILFSPFFPTEQRKISRRNTRGNRKCETILLSPPPSVRKFVPLPFHVFPNMEKSCTIYLHCRREKSAVISFTEKTAWFSRTIQIVFEELAVTDLYFCAESVFEIFDSSIFNCKILDCEPCPPTTRPRQPIEMSKYGKSRNSLKV